MLKQVGNFTDRPNYVLSDKDMVGPSESLYKPMFSEQHAASCVFKQELFFPFMKGKILGSGNYFLFCS